MHVSVPNSLFMLRFSLPLLSVLFLLHPLRMNLAIVLAGRVDEPRLFRALHCLCRRCVVVGTQATLSSPDRTGEGETGVWYCCETLELVIELAEMCPSFLRPKVSQFVGGMVQVSRPFAFPSFFLLLCGWCPGGQRPQASAKRARAYFSREKEGTNDGGAGDGTLWFSRSPLGQRSSGRR